MAGGAPVAVDPKSSGRWAIVTIVVISVLALALVVAAVWVVGSRVADCPFEGRDTTECSR